MAGACISIVIPVLNEIKALPDLLDFLRRGLPADTQIIVVDGGSNDGSEVYLKQWSLRDSHNMVLGCAQAGRASQINEGLRQAEGVWVWMLHGDSRIDVSVCKALITETGRATSQCVGPEGIWGRFDVRLADDRLVFRFIEWMMNKRSCWTGVCTGDQGIFVRREVLQTIGGVPQLALMEDIALSKKLRTMSRPLCLSQRLGTSARRWQQGGVMKTVLLMWWLRFAYWAGVSPQRLRDWYR